MRERIAKALCECHEADCCQVISDVDGCMALDVYREEADLILDAMREPTEAMLEAEENCWKNPRRIEKHCGPFNGDIWQAMIDAAKEH